MGRGREREDRGEGLKRKEGRRTRIDRTKGRSQEKMGGWGGGSGTTVKWLRCCHGDDNEGSQDTLGGWRGRGLVGLEGGRRESDGGEIVSWRRRKCKKAAGFVFGGFFTLRQTQCVDTCYTATLSHQHVTIHCC